MTLSVSNALCATAMLLFAGLAHADYLWLQSDGEGVTAHVGEVGKPPTALPVLSEPKAILTGGKALAPEVLPDRYVFKPEREGDARFTATRAGDNGVLTHFAARFGRSETKAVNDLELVPTQPGGNTFRLMFKGRAVAASVVNVDTSEGWRRVLTPADDGTVTVGTPFPGLYVLEVSVRVDNNSATVGGKTYDDVRHTATLSFEVDAPRPGEK